MFLKKDDLVSVQCHNGDSPECPKHGEFFDNEQEAEEYVEEECWIPTGDGWICPDCNIHFMRELVKVRRDKKQTEIKKKEDDSGDDNLLELEAGIDAP
ncbi:MAG: hypothetical protein G3M70_05460 [Candidatus Nitronauta litoralis]|uniref:Uncharacterized protein n=1 Tax=Candidatus Nitronauta litoralis TaxID=2705533 RepID=A0A7T0BUT1_9BACT|nr:MAG: hypothetical protein G3M70_05460 [Candidatus Nitronauta litoralis]